MDADLAPDSRHKLIEYLKRHGTASVSELSGALGLTPVTIRHHLEPLRRQGLLAEPILRRKAGPGRPERIYQLTPEADARLPRNYGELCTLLLEALARRVDGPELERLLAEAGDRAGSVVSARRGHSLASRGSQAVAFLEARGYYPSWEESQGRLRLKLANCPYLAAAKALPLLCAFDRALVSSLLGTQAILSERIIDRDPACVLQEAWAP